MPEKRRARFTDNNSKSSEKIKPFDGEKMKKYKLDEYDSDDDPSTSNDHLGEDYAKKHTLDSDEEDNVKSYAKLDIRKVEGQEDATQEYDERIKIMPFNMKDDMDEGHFDEDGNFIFNKKEKLIRDEWLDNIEWDNVKNAAGPHWQKYEEKAVDNEPEQKIDFKAVYTNILSILNPDETIAGALKRLNSQRKMSASEERKQRWAAKKSGVSLTQDSNSKTVSELTALADSLISSGFQEAYELNNVRLNELLSEIEKKHSITLKQPTIDMFAT